MAHVLFCVALTALWYGRLLTNTKVGIFDWKKESYTTEFLRDAMREGHIVPLSFIDLPDAISWSPALARSVSYWANPEVLTVSPFLVFVPWLSAPAFLKVSFAGHVLVACVGTFYVAKRLGLPVLGGVALFALTVLNPWLLQHWAIGYLPWLSACYIPAIVAALLAGRRLLPFAVGTALNALIVYEGGLHIFVWLNATIVFYAVVYAARRRTVDHLLPVGAFLAATAILALPKLFATLSAYGGWERDVVGSYGSLGDVWGLLTDRTTPLFDLAISKEVYGTPFYDGSLVVGYTFLALLACAVVLLVKRSLTARHTTPLVGWDLVLVAGAWVVLGWNGVWHFLSDRAGILETELYPYRFLWIAVILLTTVVVVELVRFGEGSSRRKVAVVAAFGIVAVSFWTRNDYFAEVATSTSFRPVASPEHHLAGLGAGVSGQESGAVPRLRASPDKVELLASPGEELPARVELPWLAPEHVSDFELVNARPVAGAALGTAIDVAQRGDRVRLEARSFHRLPLFVVAVVGYVALLFFVGRFWYRSSPSSHTGG